MQEYPKPPTAPISHETGNEEEYRYKRKLEIGKSLSEGEQVFRFPGIEPSALESLRRADEEFPGIVTPIDTLVAHCAQAGIRVMLSDAPTGAQNRDVFILPADSEDILNDSIRPEHLLIGASANNELDELIQLCKENWQYKP